MLIRDLRFALRQLHKNPGFALAAVLTLALGIGVNTAVFSLVDGFLLRPLPYPEPDRLGVLLVHLEGTIPGSGKHVSDEENSHDGGTWNWIRDNVPTVREASYGSWVSGVNLSTGSAAGDDVRFVRNMRVSAHYFNVLGLPLLLGREFSEAEDRRGGAPVAVLSYALWHTALHNDREILGKVIQLKGEPVTVVGVLPPDAQTTEIADVWTPLQPAPNGECGGTNCGIILRLAPGATWQQVDVQLSHLKKPYFDDVASKYKGHVWFHASPMTKEASRGTRTPVVVLMLAVSFILLIACANLAGLTLVRITQRTSEIATRLSLGATRKIILRQLWIESVLLAMLGAGAGLGLATLILNVLPNLLPREFMPLGGISLDYRVLAFTLLACLFTSLLFGALPALQTKRIDLRSVIAAGRSVAMGSSRLRQVLIAGEVALTVVLLAGAGLLIRTLVYLETRPPGFDGTNVIAARVSLDDARYHDANSFHALLKKSIAAMKQIPGVEDAAVGLSVPYERGLQDGVKLLDGKLRVADPDFGAGMAYVTPGYFETLKIPLLLGRDIADSDITTSEGVAIVNAELVRQFYAESNPIGRHIRAEGQTFTIVGIVGNIAKQPVSGGTEPIAIEPDFYVPATQMSQGLVNMAHVWFQPSWIVRTSKPLEGITGAMQKALASVDPSLPFSGFYSMNDILAENLKVQRAEVLLLGVLAGLALLLSAVGIYGLVSNLVVQRTREIGIRLALGAPLRQVMMEVGKSGVLASGCGLIAGMALALLAVRVLQSQLYGVRVYDPVTLTAVPLALALIAVAASFLPSLRIARIDPANTLRAE